MKRTELKTCKVNKDKTFEINRENLVKAFFEVIDDLNPGETNEYNIEDTAYYLRLKTRQFIWQLYLLNQELQESGGISLKYDPVSNPDILYVTRI